MQQQSDRYYKKLINNEVLHLYIYYF